jgi:hypothetical protein
MPKEFEYWNLPNKVTAYPDLLKTANLMESKNKRVCLLILNHCVKIIEEHEEEFLEKYPARKLDLKTLLKRIGAVQQKIREEIQQMQKRVCDPDVMSEIDILRKDAFGHLERGELIQSMKQYTQIVALIDQYRHH